MSHTILHRPELTASLEIDLTRETHGYLIHNVNLFE